MNLPPFTESQQRLRQARRVDFESTFMFVLPTVQNGLAYHVVLLEESHKELRRACYANIHRLISVNEQLRFRLTGSVAPVTLKQVEDFGGYGIVASTPPKVGDIVILTYHPHIDGKIHPVGMTLVFNGPGPVLRLSQAP